MKPVSLPAFFKTALLCLPLCGLFPCSVAAQFYWEKTYDPGFSATTYSAGETDEPDDNKNILLALVSPAGVTQQKCFFGTSDFDHGHSALEVSDNSILAVGYTSSSTVNWRKPYLIKTNWQCSTVTGSEPDPETAGISVYPNPTGAILHVDLPPDAGVSCSVEYFDALGRLVATAALRPSENETDLSFLPPGVYTYCILQNKQRLKTGKIIRL